MSNHKLEPATRNPELNRLLAALRREYMLAGLSEKDLHPNPLEQFQRWFQQTLQAGVLEPNAAVLATADAAGKPSARMILVKAVDDRGFSFFTNYGSRKARELTENPHAGLVFPWIDLERQVCIAGSISKLSRDESAAYFKMRPRGSRLGAWASNQSQVIASRAELEERLKHLEARYPAEDIPTPPNWGGYLLAPVEIEFWQGRPNRLHDRLRYAKQPDNTWRLERLAP
jgi:pyridoxamine 5'-phosphate oxidase